MPLVSTLPQTAVIKPATTSTVATKKVVRIPAATAAGLAVIMFADSVAAAKMAPMSDAPVMRPRFRDKYSRPDMTPRWSGWMSAMMAVLFAA